MEFVRNDIAGRPEISYSWDYERDELICEVIKKGKKNGTEYVKDILTIRFLDQATPPELREDITTRMPIKNRIREEYLLSPLETTTYQSPCKPSDRTMGHLCSEACERAKWKEYEKITYHFRGYTWKQTSRRYLQVLPHHSSRASWSGEANHEGGCTQYEEWGEVQGAGVHLRPGTCDPEPAGCCPRWAELVRQLFGWSRWWSHLFSLPLH